MSSTQYDKIGVLYNDIKSLPSSLIERANVQHVVKPLVKDAKVLDLACGTGYYSLAMLKWGARQVVGVDISKGMIEVAKADAAAEASMGEDGEARISFLVGDCMEPIEVEGAPFDFILGSWLLNYAPSGKEMTKMFRNISMNLKPGGRFVGVIPYPTEDPAKHVDIMRDFEMEKYGMTASAVAVLDDGMLKHVVAHTSPKKVEFDAYHLRKSVYEQSAREGGMKGALTWPEIVIPEGADVLLEGFERDFWDNYLAYPNAGILVIEK